VIVCCAPGRRASLGGKTLKDWAYSGGEMSEPKCHSAINKVAANIDQRPPASLNMR